MKNLLIIFFLILGMNTFGQSLKGPVFGELIEIYYPKYHFGKLEEGEPRYYYVNIYDNNNRIVYSNGSKQEKHIYEYDKLGNFIRENDLVHHYKYDELNRIEEDTTFSGKKLYRLIRYSYSGKIVTRTTYRNDGSLLSKDQYDIDLHRKNISEGVTYNFPDITNFECHYDFNEDFYCRSNDASLKARQNEAIKILSGNGDNLIFETRNVKKEGNKIISKNIYSIRQRGKSRTKVSENKFLTLTYDYKYDNYNNLIYRLEKCKMYKGECGNKVFAPKDCELQRDDYSYYVLTKRTIILRDEDSKKKDFVNRYVLRYIKIDDFAKKYGVSWYETFGIVSDNNSEPDFEDEESRIKKEEELENEYLRKAQTLQSENRYTEAIEEIEQHLSTPKHIKEETIQNMLNECREKLIVEKINVLERDSLYEEALSFIEEQDSKFKNTHKEDVIRLTHLRDKKEEILILRKINLLERDNLFDDALDFIEKQSEKFKESHKGEIIRITRLRDKNNERKIIEKIESYETKNDLYIANDLIENDLANPNFFQDEVSVLKDRIMKKIVEEEQNKYSLGCINMKNKNWEDALDAFKSIKYTHFDDLSKRIVKCEEKKSKQKGNR